MNKPILACENLHKTFQEGRLHTKVLYGVNLEVKAGEQIAIVGSSGSGKSTLLHLLGGLDLASQGKVWLQGQELGDLSVNQRSDLRNQHLGFIYQFHHLLPEFTALENVAMPLLIRGESVAVAAGRATELLEIVGLGQRLSHKPGELSGGERQRAAVARALVGKPACVLGDEPTGNLDERTANHVFEQLLELNTEFKTSLILVTHNIRLAARMNQRFELHMGSLRPL